MNGLRALWLAVALCGAGVGYVSAQPPAGRADTVVSSSAVAGIYRLVGEDGVVEFSDSGVGELVLIAPAAPADVAEQARLRQRSRDILDVAQVLADERLTREGVSLAQRQQRVRERKLENERIAALRIASDSVYYPARFLGAYCPHARHGFRAHNSHPYSPRRGQRPGGYEEMPHGNPPHGKPSAPGGNNRVPIFRQTVIARPRS